MVSSVEILPVDRSTRSTLPAHPPYVAMMLFPSGLAFVAVHAGLQFLRGNGGGRCDPGWDIAGQIAPGREFQSFRRACLHTLGLPVTEETFGGRVRIRIKGHHL